MCLSDETILSIYWYSYHMQSCIVAILVETATKLLNFATKSGLAWWNVVRFDMIPLPGFMYLSDEPILSVYWYSYHEQPYTVAFLRYHPESPHD